MMRDYRLLKRKYDALRHEYRLALKRPEYLLLKSEQTFLLKGLIIAVIFFSFAFAVLRSVLMVEFGVIAFIVDILWELWGTGKGWWKYQKSCLYDVCGRVPIEIPLGIAFGSGFLIALTIWIILLF
ncbi:MAG: hypothetical protein V1887_01825 [Candidatus Aenigmatarchaeota archaeon]